MQTDSCDVEHFDPRIKTTAEDSYSNWCAVLHWLNSHKHKRIEPYLPILMPQYAELLDRIRYDDGEFLPVRDDDVEATHLIRYLGWNRPELWEDRRKHISRIRDVRSMLDGDEQALMDYLRENRDQLSFTTALEAELHIEIDRLI